MTNLIQSDRPWIGGSSVAAVLCLPNPGNRTPLTECLRLWGRLPELDQADRDFFDGRKALEPWIAHKLRLHAGVVPTTFNIRYTDPEYDFIKAEIDAETADENDEFKSSTEWASRDFGEEGSDVFPVHMAAQVQYGLMVHPKETAWLNVAIGFDRFRRFQVEPDLELQQTMRERVLRFWHEHVLTGVPPEPINLSDTKALWPRSVERSILADETMVIHLRQMAQLDAQIKSLGLAKDFHRLEVEKALGDADEALGANGKPAVTYRTSKDSAKLDHEALLGSYEDQLRIRMTNADDWMEAERKKHTTIVPGVRRLLNKMKA